MNNYLKVLKHIHANPQCFQSDFVRANAAMVAEAASRGHISCVFDGKNVGRWRITDFGLTFVTIHGVGMVFGAK
ncbi:MAG: hypothetical protein ACRDCE_20285 [Cetobacterium sp.]|uniref:hypothetical protein n=1 Tax=Cetobacterium sp. TaxID=2071632 RepID=UPI003EE68C2E